MFGNCTTCSVHTQDTPSASVAHWHVSNQHCTSPSLSRGIVWIVLAAPVTIQLHSLFPPCVSQEFHPRPRAPSLLHWLHTSGGRDISLPLSRFRYVFFQFRFCCPHRMRPDSICHFLGNTRPRYSLIIDDRILVRCITSHAFIYMFSEDTDTISSIWRTQCGRSSERSCLVVPLAVVYY